MQVTHILLRIEHTKPLPDLLDLAAGRVYTLSGVSDVTAGLVEDKQIDERGTFDAWFSKIRSRLKPGSLGEFLADEYEKLLWMGWQSRANLNQPKEIQK